MSCVSMTPPVLPYNPKVNDQLALAQNFMGRGDYAMLYEAMEAANWLLRPLFAELVKAGKFSKLHKNVGPWEMKKILLLDLVNPKPFKPYLVHPGITLDNTDDAQRWIDADPKCERGTTVHFLTYLAETPSAGIKHPIAHLDSLGFSEDGYDACLYVTCDVEFRRQLRLGNMREFGRGPDWKFFAIEKRE